MFYFLSALIILLFLIIIIFSFPQFSPIPYFPSNTKDMPLIISALDIRNNQTVIDLGAGDGVVIFRAAKAALNNHLNTQFVAVEINPILLIILHLRRLIHPNRKNIWITNADMFKMNYSSLIPNRNFVTFYIYISPWFIEKTVSNILKQVAVFNLVSYFYQVKCLPRYTERVNEGVHKVFSYRSPTMS